MIPDVNQKSHPMPGQKRIADRESAYPNGTPSEGEEMPANIITIYDPQDSVKPLIPSRSRLYHLEPIGIGTPYVESLTSYINRLARAHCVLSGKLIAQEVQ